MDVSVVIVNYNTKELTSACINSIIENTQGVDYEIIIVDNSSTDGSVELFVQDQRIKFIQSNYNIGFGKANNLGYSLSSGKYLFFLNSDTLLLNNAIKLFFEKMENNSERIACMGCLLQDVEGKRMHSYADFPDMENFYVERICRGFRYLGVKRWQLDDSTRMKEKSSFFPVDYVTGADIFVRRDVIVECGLFDPDFFMYYEDTEMQWRYKKRGYVNYIYDAPKIIHLQGKSSTLTIKKFLIVFRSHMLYLAKIEPKWKVMIARFFLILKYPYIALKFHLNSVYRKELLKIILQ